MGFFDDLADYATGKKDYSKAQADERVAEKNAAQRRIDALKYGQAPAPVQDNADAEEKFRQHIMQNEAKARQGQ